MFRVPLALTPKSVCGSLAAQSWEGWAAVWTTSSIWPARSRKIRSTASASRMAALFQWNSAGWASISRWVTCEVEDSGPKKRARMSLSIPTTSKPSPTKWSTASESIRPPAPVMIATGMRSVAPSSSGVDFQRLGDALLVGGDPLVDVGQHLLGAAPRPPLVQAEEPRAVGQVYRDISLARLLHRRDRHLVAGELPADRGRLAQRKAALVAAADVHRAPVPGAGIEQLPLDQVEQVLDVEEIAHLLATPPEPDVAERVAEVVGEHPVGEDPLVDLAHLPGSGDDAAAVDHGGDTEALAVLLDQHLGGQLGGTVERPRPLEREVLGDPLRPHSPHRLRGGDLEAGLGLLQVQLHLRRHWVDAAGREEDDEGAVAPRQLQAVVGAGEVGVDEVAGVAVDPAHRRRLGRALYQRRQLRQGLQIGGLADVALDEPHPRLLQLGQIQFRAPPVEVVEDQDLPLGMARSE